MAHVTLMPRVPSGHNTAVITLGYRCCSLPGDFGFDPLGLGKDPAAIKWYREAELIHGRLAMLAVRIGSRLLFNQDGGGPLGDLCCLQNQLIASECCTL